MCCCNDHLAACPIPVDLLFGVILATIISNLVAHHLHPDGLYEAELDTKDGSCYYLRQVCGAAGGLERVRQATHCLSRPSCASSLFWGYPPT